MKDAKAIVLWGRADSGKTTTLNQVVDELLRLGATILYGKVAPCYGKDTKIKLVWSGKIIGIVTEGDSEAGIKSGCDELENDCDNCDIYVLAARSKGETLRYIEEKFEKNLIVWHRKWYVETSNKTFTGIGTLIDMANEEQAKGIVETIKQL